MRFHQLLSRADDETLQQLIGDPVVRVLHRLDPSLATPSHLRRIITDLKTPEQLLRSPETRSALLSLLPLDSAKALSRQLLDESPGDPYSVLQDLTLRRNSTVERRLFQFFEVEPEPQAPETDGEPHTECSASYGLFAHQRRAALELSRMLTTESRRVLLHMPTGAGKTRTTMHVICDHLRSHEPTLVLWLAYSEELCEQAASEFEEAWHALGNRKLNALRFWGKRDPDLSETNDGFLVAGLGKTYNRAKQSIAWLATLADDVSLVIIDEAHQAVADTYHLVLNGIKTKRRDTGLLGLTATPGRTWNDLDQDEALARFFTRRKVTLQVEGHANAVEYLINQGYLARPRFSPLHHSGGVQLDEIDRRRLAHSLDLPSQILEKLADDEVRNLSIVSRVEQLARHHRRILIFAATVAHASLLAVVLKARGLDASAITGQTPMDERARTIGAYLSDAPQTKILCNYGVLTTGFDAPATSAAVLARPTRSLVLYSQMLGRALRGPLAGGTAEAEIVTVIDPSLPAFGDLGEAFLNWEDVWQ